MSFKNGWDDAPVEEVICPKCKLYDCECAEIDDANREEMADQKRNGGDR